MKAFQTLLRSLADQLRRSITAKIDTAIITGSGMGAIVDTFEVNQRIAFEDLAEMPLPTSSFHAGEIIVANYENKNILIFNGRLHLYEGYSAAEVALPVYLAHALGAANLILTNAAGALSDRFQPGTLMLISDHINLTGQNPLLTTATADGRFVDMSQAYSMRLRNACRQIADSIGIELTEGVYAGVLGPSLETSAERRMLAQLGADAVGMSTVIETIAANHCNMQVLGLSGITNMATGDATQRADEVSEMLRMAKQTANKMRKIIPELMRLHQ